MRGRPREYDDRVSTSIRLPVDLHQRLSVAAEEREVSVNYLVNKAIADFLDRLIPADEIMLTRPRNDIR